MTRRSFTWLPELLAEIAEVAGVEVALKIAEVKGGQRVYMPAYAKQGHWLTQAIGLEAAAKICQHFRTLDPDGHEHGGRNTALIVPLGPMAGTTKRAKRTLIEGLKNGLPVREAARRAGLHERTGFYAKARLGSKAPEADAQPTLFDLGLEGPSKGC